MPRLSEPQRAFLTSVLLGRNDDDDEKGKRDLGHERDDGHRRPFCHMLVVS